ncbi:MAG: tRNA (adenosine(37)-N6)-dimethylallyltransferase MiaA, partial [Deltaproteobacteria bacterium]|nr:tRNA (adenosine(37)-N6)-dimethylallyltransferase MiaA [Deltaproteobacteria bacterium]
RGVDKVSADKIHPNNVVRVIRALEVYKETGRPISELHSEHGEAPSEFDPLCIALGRDRTELRARIDARVEKMMDGGLLREVESLFDRGYDASLKSMNSLGYKEMAGHINGALELDDAISNIKLNTKRYAKRQFTWFGNDKDYKWFDIGEKTDIITRIKEYYKDNDND